MSDNELFAENVRKLMGVGRAVADFVSILKRTTGGEPGLRAGWLEIFGKPMPLPAGTVTVGTATIHCFDREHFAVLYNDGSGDIRRVPWGKSGLSGPPNIAAQLMAAIGQKILGIR